MKKRTETIETILIAVKIFILCFLISYIFVALITCDIFLLNNSVITKFFVLLISIILMYVVVNYNLEIYFAKFKFGDLLIPITKINDYIKKIREGKENQK